MAFTTARISSSDSVLVYSVLGLVGELLSMLCLVSKGSAQLITVRRVDKAGKKWYSIMEVRKLGKNIEFISLTTVH